MAIYRGRSVLVVSQSVKGLHLPARSNQSRLVGETRAQTVELHHERSRVRLRAVPKWEDLQTRRVQSVSLRDVGTGDTQFWRCLRLKPRSRCQPVSQRTGRDRSSAQEGRGDHRVQRAGPLHHLRTVPAGTEIQQTRSALVRAGQPHRRIAATAPVAAEVTRRTLEPNSRVFSASSRRRCRLVFVPFAFFVGILPSELQPNRHIRNVLTRNTKHTKQISS